MEDDTGFEVVPERYATAEGEVIDIVRKQYGDDAFVSHCLITARVYELRAGKKGPAEVDHQKARWYRMMALHVLSGGVEPDPRSYRKPS